MNYKQTNNGLLWFAIGTNIFLAVLNILSGNPGIAVFNCLCGVLCAWGLR